MNLAFISIERQLSIGIGIAHLFIMNDGNYKCISSIPIHDKFELDELKKSFPNVKVKYQSK